MSRTSTFLFSLVVLWLGLDLFALVYGVAPATVLREFILGTWGTGYGIGQILFKAAPLIFTGLAVRIALHAGLFNIGAEGQLTAASLAIGVAGMVAPAGPVGLPFLLLAGSFAGGAFALVPAYFAARGGGGLALLAAILMNRLADPLVALLLHAGLAEKDSTHTPPMRATLANLGHSIHAFEGSALSVAFPIALVVAALGASFIRRSRIAREWSYVRENEVAAKKVGIPAARHLALAMIVSGAIAGLGGLGTVAGYKGYYEQGIGAGTGFAGMGVALLGGESALGIVAASLLFGTLSQGGLAVNALIPREIFQLFEAGILILVSLLSGETFDIVKRALGGKR